MPWVYGVVAQVVSVFAVLQLIALLWSRESTDHS